MRNMQIVHIRNLLSRSRTGTRDLQSNNTIFVQLTNKPGHNQHQLRRFDKVEDNRHEYSLDGTPCAEDVPEDERKRLTKS